MVEKPDNGLLSQLIPDEIEARIKQGMGQTTEATDDPQTSAIASMIKGLGGQMGGGMEAELNNFLKGKGTLLETTQGAIASGGASVRAIEDMLVKQFNLSRPIASILAPLLVRLLPAVGKQPADQPKTAARKTSTSAKTTTRKTSPAAKRPAAKTPAANRPAAKTPAAKRPAAKRPAAKTPAAKRKTRTSNSEE